MTVPAKPIIAFVPLQDPLGFKLMMSPTLLVRFDSSAAEAVAKLRNVGRVSHQIDHIEVRLRADWRIQQRNALLAEVRKTKRILRDVYGDNIEIDTSGLPEPHCRPARALSMRRPDRPINYV